MDVGPDLVRTIFESSDEKRSDKVRTHAAQSAMRSVPSGLSAILAGAMYLTRGFDWYSAAPIDTAPAAPSS